jgi:hypothetical protein
LLPSERETLLSLRQSVEDLTRAVGALTAHLEEQQAQQRWSARALGVVASIAGLVLSAAPLAFPTPDAERDRLLLSLIGVALTVAGLITYFSRDAASRTLVVVAAIFLTVSLANAAFAIRVAADRPGAATALAYGRVVQFVAFPIATGAGLLALRSFPLRFGRDDLPRGARLWGWGFVAVGVVNAVLFPYGSL